MNEVPHSRENAIRFFADYLKENDVRGKKVIDLSAGSGYIIAQFHKAGADVELYDLFPGQNTFCPVACKKIDLQKPFGDIGKADIVLLGETIEHLPNQFFFFTEVAKLLKPNGVFILTTPNPSSLRSRMSQFLMESEHYSTPAPNELDGSARWPGTNDVYFGKLFISGLLRLRTLAAMSGLKIRKIHRTKASSTAFFLLIFYPFLYYFSRKNLSLQLKVDPANDAVYKEIFRLNTSLSTLTSKHLIVEWESSSASGLQTRR
jgi:SAM-dependent methyltransferase